LNDDIFEELTILGPIMYCFLKKRGYILLLMLLVNSVTSCKFGGFSSETKSGKYRACKQEIHSRCVEPSGKNKASFDSCPGEAILTCPVKDRVGSCINKKGSDDEATIRYYNDLDSARKDCEEMQDIHGGIFIAD